MWQPKSLNNLKLSMCAKVLFLYWQLSHLYILTAADRYHSVVVYNMYIFPCLSVESPPSVAEIGGSGKRDTLSQQVNGKCG